MKYIIKLDDKGYYHPESRWKPTSEDNAKEIDKYKDANEIAVKLRKLGYSTSIEKKN